MTKPCHGLMQVAGCVFLMLAELVFARASLAESLVVGSKRFTESYILGEIISQSLKAAGASKVTLKSGLGNTGILLSALRSGEIDVYPEYTGTITREILQTEQNLSLDEINARLLPSGLQAGILLGFDNSYVLAVRRELAQELSLRRISDLTKHSTLVLGFSHEFMGRGDGWRALADRYQLGRFVPRGLDHGLAYEAIRARQIDVMDAYGTDSKLVRDGLVVLEDDLNFFPSYRALLLFRADLPVRHAVAWKVLSGLENTISQQTMAQLNAQVEVDGHSFAGVARDYLARSAPVHQRFQLDSVAGVPTEKSFSRHSFVQVLFGADFWRLGAQHLFLVLASLSLALVVGIPLGILSFYRPKIGQIVLSIASVIQTIPSLALLAFLISVMGLIGTIPAIVALFLYALLPIIQSTHAGFAEISPAMRQAATALGLSARDQILLIELPLARTMVMSGIKVSAVLSVGTATIAAFVGAGGFGERIAQGLALNDTSMLLAGAIPAAALALLFQYVFFIVERWLKRNKN